MADLQRLTTEYCDVEDRVRLTGAVTDQAPVVLWLTQRLLQRLVPPLVQWLEQSGRALPRADVLQSFAQHAAQAELIPQAPVRGGADSASWLVHSIEFASTDRVVRLTFKGADRHVATLTMTATLLRQWMAILHMACRKAGWPLDLWPAWMTETTAPAKPAAMALH